MKEDYRQAKAAVSSCCEVGEKQHYIEKCAISKTDREILRRRVVLEQSFVKIANEMHMSERSVKMHYRNSMLILRVIVEKYRR